MNLLANASAIFVPMAEPYIWTGGFFKPTGHGMRSLSDCSSGVGMHAARFVNVDCFVCSAYCLDSLLFGMFV